MALKRWKLYGCILLVISCFSFWSLHNESSNIIRIRSKNKRCIELLREKLLENRIDVDKKMTSTYRKRIGKQWKMAIGQLRNDIKPSNNISKQAMRQVKMSAEENVSKPEQRKLIPDRFVALLKRSHHVQQKTIVKKPGVITIPQNETIEITAKPLTFPHKLKVIIWTMGRSGSSFLGSLFNYHRSVFYYYEPLQGLYSVNGFTVLERKGSRRYTAFKKSIDFVSDLLGCHIKESNKYILNKISTMNTRLSSNGLILPPVCNHTQKTMCLKEHIRPELLRQACKENFTHVVIKELSPRFPGRLYLFQKKNPFRHHTKIIHLVRDPRAVLNSMSKAGWETQQNVTKFQKRAEKVCKPILSDIKDGMKYLQPLGLYKLVRYEDLCLDFDKTIANLLEYSNLEVYPEYRLYMKNVIKVKKDVEKFKSNVYSIKRNIKDQVDAWRNVVTLPINNAIENACGDLMHVLGYKKIKGNETILRNTKVNLLRKVRIQDMR